MVLLQKRDQDVRKQKRGHKNQAGVIWVQSYFLISVALSNFSTLFLIPTQLHSPVEQILKIHYFVFNEFFILEWRSWFIVLEMVSTIMVIALLSKSCLPAISGHFWINYENQSWTESQPNLSSVANLVLDWQYRQSWSSFVHACRLILAMSALLLADQVARIWKIIFWMKCFISWCLV